MDRTAIARVTHPELAASSTNSCTAGPSSKGWWGALACIAVVVLLCWQQSPPTHLAAAPLPHVQRQQLVKVHPAALELDLLPVSQSMTG
jgi:hypothetical protein